MQGPDTLNDSWDVIVTDFLDDLEEVAMSRGTRERVREFLIRGGREVATSSSCSPSSPSASSSDSSTNSPSPLPFSSPLSSEIIFKVVPSSLPLLTRFEFALALAFISASFCSNTSSSTVFVVSFARQKLVLVHSDRNPDPGMRAKAHPPALLVWVDLIRLVVQVHLVRMMHYRRW